MKNGWLEWLVWFKDFFSSSRLYIHLCLKKDFIHEKALKAPLSPPGDMNDNLLLIVEHAENEYRCEKKY